MGATDTKETIALVLTCEGMGDCLYAIPVIRKLYRASNSKFSFVIFTKHPGLFEACPYVTQVFEYSLWSVQIKNFKRWLKLFDLTKFKFSTMDTIDLISLGAGLGQLSFREKQMEYFPTELDKASAYDVVLNTSITWPCRSWPLEGWQKLADALLACGLSVAVVGKDVQSKVDKMQKQSPNLSGCVNLCNLLSLDQTFFTIAKAGLFVSCQNGLSVLSSCTDAQVIVLDQSIEWSKYAMYRHEDPHYKVTYVKGDCQLYCCQSFKCPLPENKGEFKCIPGFAAVWAAVEKALSAPQGLTLRLKGT